MFQYIFKNIVDIIERENINFPLVKNLNELRIRSNAMHYIIGYFNWTKSLIKFKATETALKYSKIVALISNGKNIRLEMMKKVSNSFFFAFKLLNKLRILS